MAKKTKRARVTARKSAPPNRKATVPSRRVASTVSELAVRKASIKLFLAQRAHADALERLQREQRPRIAKAMVARKPRILVEGDSWFKYDCGHGVIWYLQSALGRRVEIVNLAGSTATLSGMLDYPQRKEFETVLRSSRDWHCVLFSGGGNDAVGSHFDKWLVPDYGQADPSQAIDYNSWNIKRGEMRAHFVKLAEIVAAATDAPLYVNAYDFAIPNGIGILGKKWLAPAFKKKGYGQRTLDFKCAVVRTLLQDFANLISEVGVQCPNVRLLPTQGTLERRDWENELHPDSGGFKKIASVVRRAINL